MIINIKNEDAIENLRLKILWTRHVNGIPWDRVVNADQIAVRMLPTSDFGWGATGRRCKWLADVKTQITCMLCVGTQPGSMTMAQIIFGGKTNRVLPTGPHAANIAVAHTKSHWSSVDTMLDLIAELNKRMNPEGDHLDWILVLDVAPVHCSVEFRWRVSTEWPWVHLVYVPPRFTGVAQPVDVAFGRTFFIYLL